MEDKEVEITLKIDWPLLYEQKLLLIHLQEKIPACQGMLEGLLSILDAIQDQGEDQGHPVYKHLEEK